MKNIIFIFLFVAASFLFPAASFTLEGWNKEHINNEWVYTPNDLKQGKTFNFVVSPAEQLHGQSLRDWLSGKITQIQSKLGKPNKKWEIKPEKNGGLGASNSFHDSSGEKLSVGYQGNHLDDSRVFLVRMVSSSDIGLFLKYGLAFDSVIEDAKATLLSGKNDKIITSTSKPDEPKKQKVVTQKSIPSFNNDLAILTPKERRKEIERRIRTAPNKGVKLSDLTTIWVDSNIDVLWGGLDVVTYFLFKDGSAYLDSRTPPSDFNVTVSRKLEERGRWKKHSKWTQWRKVSGGYEIKNVKNEKWKKLEGKKAIPGNKEERLDNIFWSFSGSEMTGSHKSSIRLMSDGRFEMSSSSMMGGDMGGTGPYVGTVTKSDKEGSSGTTVVAGERIGGGASTKKKDGSKNTGTYKIEGYTIELHHDNGWVHRELFLFDKTDKSSIIIKDEKYWVKKK